VIDIRAAMSMAQEMLEDSVNQIKTNVEENAKEGVDTKMVVEAITAVGTLVGGIIVEVASKLPKPEFKGIGEGCARETVIAEVDKIIGRMGLVQEDELAALRKRVVDLEAALAKSEKPAPKTKS
jgi:BMFP domain-containing protein YqiC